MSTAVSLHKVRHEGSVTLRMLFLVKTPDTINDALNRERDLSPPANQPARPRLDTGSEYENRDRPTALQCPFSKRVLGLRSLLRRGKNLACSRRTRCQTHSCHWVEPMHPRSRWNRKAADHPPTAR